MSQNYRYTGVKISQYPHGEINTTNHKNKLNHSHYFMSYAPTNYGISEINKNFQVPIEVLRKDFIGYIGLSNAKADWRDYINFWEGDWVNQERTRSYVYEWDDIKQQHELDYIFNKHALNTKWDAEHDIHRVYLLNTAPLPLEAEDTHFSSLEERTLGFDVNPHNVKFVSKNYVDDRHNGVRKVDVQDYGLMNPSHLTIRPYTCFYQYSSLPEMNNDGCYYIDIHDDCVLEDGKTFYDKVKHNRLTFYLRLKNFPDFYVNNGVHCNNLKILANGSERNVLWSYEDEWTEILREHRLKIINGQIQNKQKTHLFLKCEAEYIDGIFTITCSSFFGRKKDIKRMVEVPITDNGIVNLDLSLHENECFVSQIPLDEIQDGQNEIKRDQTVINFDVSKLDDYHIYSWDYYIITPDDTANDGKWDYDKLVFGGTPILWANDATYNTSPELQPNKMYCIEFSKAFDGCLIGRIKYYISLIQKDIKPSLQLIFNIKQDDYVVDISKTWFYTGQFNNGSGNKVTANYDFRVDWGDGTNNDFYSSNDAVNNYIPVSHKFKRKGLYRVTITGICDNLYGYDGTENGGAKKSYALVDCLYGVVVPKDSTSPLKYAYGSFYGCSNLRYVGYGVLHNITECKEIPHLYDGTMLQQIESWMLYGGSNLENIEYLFANCKMTFVDKDLFKYCTKVTKANNCFNKCDALIEIPNNLLDSMPKLQNVGQMFKACSNLITVPQTLFDNCLEISDCHECFCGGSYNGDNSHPSTMKITSPLPPLWERGDIAYYSAYAHGCTSSSNYQIAASKGWA